MILQAAQEWSVPPWVVEEQASREWWERWGIWRTEQQRFRKQPQADTGTDDGRLQN